MLFAGGLAAALKLPCLTTQLLRPHVALLWAGPAGSFVRVSAQAPAPGAEHLSLWHGPRRGRL